MNFPYYNQISVIYMKITFTELCNIALNIFSVYFCYIFSDLMFFNFILQFIICYIRLNIIVDEDLTDVVIKKNHNILFYTIILVTMSYIKCYVPLISTSVSEIGKYIAKKCNILN